LAALGGQRGRLDPHPERRDPLRGLTLQGLSSNLSVRRSAWCRLDRLASVDHGGGSHMHWLTGGRTGGSRHRDVQGGTTRAAVLGAGDGLLTNLSLTLGVAGASTNAPAGRRATW